ncbi:ParA family protein [Sphaerospermopsis sp. LEGE 08334]|uniref:ParA family protein n=1 Tax=Sphaerospermopsis sp. LEGE 08334 TaxID=1828651 RepID=UPI00187F0C63|nr:ParA family protein [Sphaerospermopsis sp. LEGE 08334]MBE9056738.1 ParA family protein [Sphaerospermopsis sp. LEGE 08334]
MATVVSMINMKGGVGKTTLTFNLAWYCAWKMRLRVLAIDLDPQANLSQYFMGAERYLRYIQNNQPTVVDIFNEPRSSIPVHDVPDFAGITLHLIASRLDLAWSLIDPKCKIGQILPQSLSAINHHYDLIIIDCAPTESLLTTAAYNSSRYVIVPVKPEFLAAIGLPLLVKSLKKYKEINRNQKLEIAGIIFNDHNKDMSPEEITSCRSVRNIAENYGWKVFESTVHRSRSFAAGSRERQPIFNTPRARTDVKYNFDKVAEEFLKAVKLR